MGMRSSSSSGCTDPGTMAVMPTCANSRELAAASAISTCAATAFGPNSPVLLDHSGRGSPNRALVRFFTSSENRSGGPHNEARLRSRHPEVPTQRSRTAPRRRRSGGAPAGRRREGLRQSARARLTARGDDTGQIRSSGEGVASELRSEPLKSSGQDVCDHAGSEGVPVVRRIAPPTPGGSTVTTRSPPAARCRAMLKAPFWPATSRSKYRRLMPPPGIHTHSRGVRTDTRGTKRSAAIRWQPAGATALTSTLTLDRRTASSSASDRVRSTGSEFSCATSTTRCGTGRRPLYVARSATAPPFSAATDAEQSCPVSLWA